MIELQEEKKKLKIIGKKKRGVCGNWIVNLNQENSHEIQKNNIIKCKNLIVNKCEAKYMKAKIDKQNYS